MVIAARSEGKLNAIKDTLLESNPKNPVHVVTADLSNQEACEALIEKVWRFFYDFDFHVCCIGKEEIYGRL